MDFGQRKLILPKTEWLAEIINYWDSETFAWYGLRQCCVLVSRFTSAPLSSREDVLILTSGKAKTVQIITLDFIQEINISGSPFKGKAEAPVAVATFNDFE